MRSVFQTLFHPSFLPEIYLIDIGRSYLLLTVPGISHIDQGDWKRYWFWSFTESSITRLLSEIFPAENVNVETYGNVLVATAFLYGIGLPEVKKEQMDFKDPHYQVIISAIAVKPN